MNPPAALLLDARNRADCTRRQVGAVLTSPEGEVLGVGHNGLPRGSCSLGECPRGLLTYDQQPAFSDYRGNCAAVHAEVRALLAAGRLPDGTTCWTTCEPCRWCADSLARAGVARVVVVNLEA